MPEAYFTAMDWVAKADRAGVNPILIRHNDREWLQTDCVPEMPEPAFHLLEPEVGEAVVEILRGRMS